MTKKSFQFKCKIGQGSFGVVFLVRKKNTGEYFAMKVLEKKKIFVKNQ